MTHREEALLLQSGAGRLFFSSREQGRSQRLGYGQICPIFCLFFLTRLRHSSILLTIYSPRRTEFLETQCYLRTVFISQRAAMGNKLNRMKGFVNDSCLIMQSDMLQFPPFSRGNLMKTFNSWEGRAMLGHFMGKSFRIETLNWHKQHLLW